MIITVEKIKDLREQLITAQKELEGKKVWIYFQDILVYALGLKYGLEEGPDSTATCYLPETKMKFYIRINERKEIDDCDYNHVVLIASEEINFIMRFKGEPDDIVFVKLA